jgi:hypothetical protein
MRCGDRQFIDDSRWNLSVPPFASFRLIFTPPGNAASIQMYHSPQGERIAKASM